MESMRSSTQRRKTESDIPLVLPLRLKILPTKTQLKTLRIFFKKIGKKTFKIEYTQLTKTIPNISVTLIELLSL